VAAPRDVIPPLFTLGGPVGWMVALGSYIFGLGRGNAARQKAFRDFHQKRNAARKWERGANQAAQESVPVIDKDTGIQTGRVARDLFWFARELDKLEGPHSGKTMNRAERDASRANPAARAKMQQQVNREKVQAQAKVSAQRAAQRSASNDSYWRRARAGGIAGPLAGGIAGAAVEPSVAVLSQVLFRRAELELERSDAAKRLSTLSNRRGSLASRGFQPSGSTNRTGAGSTRAFQPQPELSKPNAATKSGASGGQSAQSQHANTGSVTGESAASKQAKAVLSGSKSLPAQVSQAATQSPLVQAARLGVAALLQSTVFATPAASFTNKLGEGSPLTSSSTSIPGLTALEAQGVQSASAGNGCRCPKPPAKKAKKDGKPRCKNPVISRTTKDGIRTTKVELKCQPSKPK